MLQMKDETDHRWTKLGVLEAFTRVHWSRSFREIESYGLVKWLGRQSASAGPDESIAYDMGKILCADEAWKEEKFDYFEVQW
jgi:hypothetical protein